MKNKRDDFDHMPLVMLVMALGCAVLGLFGFMLLFLGVAFAMAIFERF